MTQEKTSISDSGLNRRSSTPGTSAILLPLALTAIACLVTGCCRTFAPASVNAAALPAARAAADCPAVPIFCTNENALVSEQSLLAVLWYQYAAECRALYYQACNIARERIDTHLETRRRATTPDPRTNAIIVDIDETVLDNSAYNAWLITNGTAYNSATFQKWVTDEQALVLPGLSNLFRHASNNGVEILYVSNRKPLDNGLAHTITNLSKQGLPYADSNHIFLRTGGESKDDRRDPLLARYDVILLMGDNLADFHHDFESPTNTLAGRRENTDRDAALFGTKYIVLPNPMYGTWENALYPVTATNKSVLRHQQLRERTWAGPK